MKSYLDVVDDTDLESVEAIEEVLDGMVAEINESKMDKYIVANVMEGIEYLEGTAALELLNDDLGEQHLTEYVEQIKEMCKVPESPVS